MRVIIIKVTCCADCPKCEKGANIYIDDRTEGGCTVANEPLYDLDEIPEFCPLSVLTIEGL